MKTFSQPWTTSWRRSATSSSWSLPGQKTSPKTTVRDLPPPPRLLPKTHLPMAPQLRPPALLPPATSTWRCSIQRRWMRRRRQRAVTKSHRTERSPGQNCQNPGAGEKARSVFIQLIICHKNRTEKCFISVGLRNSGL